MRVVFSLGMAFLALGSCSPAPPKSASVLLFDGAGASPGDVAAIEAVLAASGIGYATANSRQLDAMGEADLKTYRLLIVPGGNFVRMGQGLAPATPVKIRRSVSGGLNYLGVCAGAFLAGDSPINRLYNGINLTGGVRFPFYSAENRGLHKSAVKVTPVGSAAADQYWEDGPQLSNWGSVVARYEDGTPAVAEAKVGDGFVLLTGIHPEAPENWRQGLSFSTSASANAAYAAQLIKSALNGAPLPHE